MAGVDAEPIFLEREEVEEIHAQQLREHGGGAGVRDPGQLAAAIFAPRNVYHYDPSADLYDLAAAYAFHISESQAYVDGNKRTGMNAALVFLGMNDVPGVYPWLPLYDALLLVAHHACDRADLAALFRTGVRPQRGAPSPIDRIVGWYVALASEVRTPLGLLCLMDLAPEISDATRTTTDYEAGFVQYARTTTQDTATARATVATTLATYIDRAIDPNGPPWDRVEANYEASIAAYEARGQTHAADQWRLLLAEIPLRARRWRREAEAWYQMRATDLSDENIERWRAETERST